VEQTNPSANAVSPVADTSLRDLIDRAADLKGELLEFVRGPAFSRQLNAQLKNAVGHGGFLDEHAAVRAIDHFALQHRLPDGRTTLERFAAQRRPPLSDDERQMLLGWGEVVEGCFEVSRPEHDGVVLHNLLDDLTYSVHSNLGPDALAWLHEGMFVIGRIVPIHPATDAWLVSGHLRSFAGSDAAQVAQIALRILTANPYVMCRNPNLLRRAWELQAEHRADFVAHFGSDLVVLPPEQAQRQLQEHYRHRLDKATVNRDATTRNGANANHPTAEELGKLPEELLDAESVALIYDEVDGLNYYRDFARLDALFADPSLARDHTYLSTLRHYLRDESISPLPIRRLTQRHPEGADPVFQALLRKPRFSWERDGEQLLRTRKKDFFAHEATPSISVIGDRLAELLSPSHLR
jgi:hypothetical protein